MEQEQYVQVKTTIKRLLNINLEHYKEEQMRRRLDSWLVRSGSPSWNVYTQKLKSDAQELSRLRDYLTINVSAFFRDAERWAALKTILSDVLLKESLHLRPGNPGLKMWSAGCSIGAEPYSLAMMVDEISSFRRHSLLATDLDRGVLKKARERGPYNAEELQNLTPAQRNAYLEPNGQLYFIKESLAKSIDFREHDLLSDAFPSGMDLIICRNVVIYFTAEAKDELYRKFRAALRPGGIFFVGATEIIPRPGEIGFKGYGISFYQRV
jgi:chemotaxis protein methyltransferase CheR